MSELVRIIDAYAATEFIPYSAFVTIRTVTTTLTLANSAFYPHSELMGFP